MQLDYISLFSGIEAASVAWGPLGWSPVAFAETEPFPSAVLAERFPDVPNLGDVTIVDWREWNGRADLVIGGSPCQSFSVAGLRKGLADPRGNLMLEYLRACEAIAPEWIVWENVPGVLSSNGGADFQALLEAVAELWPDGGCAWRVLDAQFFGVAQRRRRVFLVVNTRDWRRAAAVLQDPASLHGNSSASRAKREELAGTAGYRAPFHRRWDALADAPEHDGVGATCLQGSMFGRAAQNGPRGRGVSEELTFTLNTVDRHAVCAAFKYHQGASAGSIGYADEQAPTLSADHPPAVLAFAQNSRDEVRYLGGNVCGALAASSGAKQTTYVMQEAVCMASGQANAEVLVGQSPTLTALHERPVVCLADGGAKAARDEGEPASAPRAREGGGAARARAPLFAASADAGPRIAEGSAPAPVASGQKACVVDPNEWIVRGLTPVEAERLQGFPDDWTKVAYRGKPADGCPDAPRFKACGNSMAVPVIQWLGERVEMVDELTVQLMLEGEI